MMLDKYKEYLKYELNYSELTISEYLLHLNKFFEYLEKHGLDFKNLYKEDVINYLKFLDNKKLSNKTISNKLSALRTYYDYLIDEHIINNNVFRLISNPKIDKKLPNFLSYEEFMDILNSIECNDELDYRNRLIVEALFDTGIRVSELVNLKLENINYNDRTIRILGKGKKERIVYFGSYLENAINDYLKVRTTNSEYLILNFKGNKITTRGVEKIIDKIIMGLSLNTKISPHTFRHSFATQLLNNGADIKSVQELLGHSSLNTTEIYTHITSDFLKSEYLKNMPRK